MLINTSLASYLARPVGTPQGGTSANTLPLSRFESELEPDLLPLTEEYAEAVEELDGALERLAELSPRKARLLEQRYFGGLKLEECAEALGVSLATVKNDLSFGRAWLARELGPHSGAAGTAS